MKTLYPLSKEEQAYMREREIELSRSIPEEQFETGDSDAEIERKANINIKKYTFIANQVEKEILERRHHHE